MRFPNCSNIIAAERFAFKLSVQHLCCPDSSQDFQQRPSGGRIKLGSHWSLSSVRAQHGKKINLNHSKVVEANSLSFSQAERK